MPRRCTVCTRPQRDEVDHELAVAAVRHVKRHITRHAVAPCPDPEREVPA